MIKEEVINEQFKRLEEKVKGLVQICHDLQDGRSRLEAKINNLEDALRRKDASEQRYIEEKSVVRSRIGDLLKRLDEVLGST